MNSVLVGEELQQLLRARIQELQDEIAALANAVLEHGKKTADVTLLATLVEHTQKEYEHHQVYMKRLQELSSKLQ